MELTAADLRQFAGGKIEIQNQNGKPPYLYSGQIKSIKVQGTGKQTKLVVELEWKAKGEGYPPLPTRWVKADTKTYVVYLMTCAISGSVNERLILGPLDSSEIAVLFPKGRGNMVDRSVVEGL